MRFLETLNRKNESIKEFYPLNKGPLTRFFILHTSARARAHRHTHSNLNILVNKKISHYDIS